jgi:hypothetical protein
MPVSQNKSATYGALLLILCGMPAHADNEDVIAMCARIATVGDRILCLENALRQSSHEVAEIPVVEAVPVDETPVPEAMPAKEIAVVEVAPAIETAVTEATPVIKTAVVEAVPANDDIPAANENFGLKEKRPPKETTTVQVTITSVRKNLTNRFIFETGNGQLWLQTDQRTVRYGDVPFEAEIRPASMGSFFLRPVTGGASVRVRREK